MQRQLKFCQLLCFFFVREYTFAELLKIDVFHCAEKLRFCLRLFGGNLISFCMRTFIKSVGVPIAPPMRPAEPERTILVARFSSRPLNLNRNNFWQFFLFSMIFIYLAWLFWILRLFIKNICFWIHLSTKKTLKKKLLLKIKNIFLVVGEDKKVVDRNEKTV